MHTDTNTRSNTNTCLPSPQTPDTKAFARGWMATPNRALFGQTPDVQTDKELPPGKSARRARYAGSPVQAILAALARKVNDRSVHSGEHSDG